MIHPAGPLAEVPLADLFVLILANAATHPDVVLGLFLNGEALAVGLLLRGWMAPRATGTFHDQGGMIITLIILPCRIALWIAGGPLALIISVRARAEMRSTSHPGAGKMPSLAAILLSSLTFLGGAGFVAGSASLRAASVAFR